MSWDIVLFNSKQKIEPVKELDEDQLEQTDFCRILEDSFMTIKKEGSQREIIGTDFKIDFFSDCEYSSNILLSIYGENGIYPLIELAKKHRWQIYDSAHDEMIDLENSNKSGFKSHRKFVEQIIKTK